MDVAIMGIAAAAVSALAYSALSFFVSEERQVKKQLKTLDSYEIDEMVTAEPLLLPFRERVLSPLSRLIADAARLLAPSDYIERMNKRLTLAGNPGGMSSETFVGLKAVLAIATGFVFLLFGIANLAAIGRTLFISFVLALLAFFLPDLWLRSRIDSRKLAIRRTLPDMLDMLTISVEAGMGFDAAVARVVSSRPGPLSEEFGRMLQEVQAGVARRDALRRLAERTQVLELNAFIMAIVQADVFGVTVSNVLRTQSREMRVKRRQFAEEQAQKAPVKLVFPLVLCILPATLIVIGGPAIVGIGRAFGLLD